MKRICLTHNRFALVDDSDFDWLNQYKWSAKKCSRNMWYAQRVYKGKLIYMHREILRLTFGDGISTDHKNHNGLDNQKDNLRRCSAAQNQHNQLPRHKSSKYKGVFWNKCRKMWEVVIQYNKKRIWIGRFASEAAAAAAYDRLARKLFGKFGQTNF